VPKNPGPSAPPTSPTRGTDINAQLAQARECEANLAEEYRAVRLLRASIAGEASARGERARELGKQARERINTNFNVDDPKNAPVHELEGSCPLPRRPRHGICTIKHKAHRASGRATGRKLDVPHTPAGQRTG
jgi:hypothetical protein